MCCLQPVALPTSKKSAHSTLQFYEKLKTIISQNDRITPVKIATEVRKKVDFYQDVILD